MIRSDGHLDQEQPRVDRTTEETREDGRDHPVEATVGFQREAKPGYGDEHGGNRVGEAHTM